MTWSSCGSTATVTDSPALPRSVPISASARAARTFGARNGTTTLPAVGTDSSLSCACSNVSAASWNDALAVMVSPSRAAARPRLAASRPASMRFFASFATSATGATAATSSTISSADRDLERPGQAGRLVTVDRSARGFGREDDRHDDPDRDAYPDRQHRAPDEHADGGEDDLREHQEDDGLARRPTEHCQPVHEVVGAVRHE